MTRVRLLLAFAAGCIVAVFLYALLRAGQVLSGGEANPATVIVRSQHLAYLWRAWTSLFGGALGAVSVYVISDRHAPLVARALVRALAVTVVVLVGQAVVLP